MNDYNHKRNGRLNLSPASSINEKTGRRLTGIGLRLLAASLAWLGCLAGSPVFAAGPVISGPSALSMSEDFGSTNLDFTVTDADTPIFAVKTWATSSNTNLVTTDILVTDDNLKMLGLSKTRQLSFAPLPNANGTAILTVFASDGTSTNSKAVTLTVSPVNDVPSFALLVTSITVNEDSITYTNNTFATSVSRGPTNEITQTATFLVTPQIPSDTNKFAIQPAITVTGTNTTGTLTFKPALNQSSSSPMTFNVRLQDNGGTTNGGVNLTAVPQTFTIAITPVNDAPVISGLLGTLTMFEDKPATNSFTVADVDTSLNLIALTATTSPSGLVGVSLAGAGTTSGTGTNWTMIITPISDKNSVSPITVTITANDQQSANNTTVTNILVTLTPVNDKPSFTIASDPPTVLEDAGPQTVTTFVTSPSAGPTDESSQSMIYLLTYTPTNSLVSININNAGTLSYQTALNFAGVISVTAKAQDNGGTSFGGVNLSDPHIFTITVTAVNDAPVISGLPSTLTMIEDKKSTNSFTLADVDTAITNVILSATSSDTATIPNSNITFSGTGTNRTMIITPAPDANSASPITITITADDQQLANNTTSTTVAVTVTAVNDRPSFTLAGNQGISPLVNEDAGPQSVSSFVTASSVGPADESAQTITSYLVTTSSNAFFTTLPAISTAGTLTYTTANNANGTVTVKVQAQDSGGTNNGGVNLSLTNSFTITVTAVNDPTVITGLPATLTMYEDRATNITFQISDIDTPITNVTMSAFSSSDTAAIPLSSITFSGTGTNRTMTILPATNANSVAAINLVIHAFDPGSPNNTVSGNIAVVVIPVNDPPSFALASTSVTPEKFGTVQTVTSFATAISKGAANESSQTIGFTATAATPSLFSRQPTISATGILTFTVVNGASGSSTVSVYATDNGGLANGGANQSAPQSFTVTVPPNPFQYLSGEFNGLFYLSSGVAFTSSGFLKFTVNTNGLITGGTVVLAGKQYTLLSGAGQFNIDTSAPTATFTVNRSADSLPNLAITVVLDASDNWTESFSGTVSNGTWTADLLGDHAYKDTYGYLTDGMDSFDAGKYTLFVPGNGTNNPVAPAPSGFGWGTVTVDADGTVHLAGELADGQAIAQTTSVSANGMWPLFGNLYTGATQDGGVLLGWVTFDNTDPNNDLSGAVSWIMNPDASASDYLAGFVNDSTLEGSAYVAPSSLQSAFDPLTSGSVTFDQGGLSSAYKFYCDFAIGTPWNVVASGTLSPTIDANNTLVLTPTTGAISGTFDNGVIPLLAPATFKGVVFQKTSTGRGYFMNSDPAASPISGGSVLVGP